MPTDADALATRWCRAMRSLATGVRTLYLRSELAKHSIEAGAEALDQACAAAERGGEGGRELLVVLVDLLAAHDLPYGAEAMRSQAARAGCSSLLRVIEAARDTAPARAVGGEVRVRGEARVPDYTGGRPLTLGERKALARRPTRASLAKLLADPHPAVVRALLANPKLVEADVVRMAAARPALAEVLVEIARSPRWAHRVNVRMALVLNPESPIAVATPFLALLTRPELRQVVEAGYLGEALRTAARELLIRRSPARPRGGDAT